jgi:hypothetical protein
VDTSFELTESALLTAEDVGDGYTATYDLQGDDHGSLLMLMSYCGETDYTEAGQHVVEFRKGSVFRDDQHFVLTMVVRYDGSWAGQHLDDLRAALPRCARVPIMGDLDDVATLTVVDNDFAGDGSLLVREDGGAGTQYHGVVWRGDVEALLRIHTSSSESEARDLVVAAAERLCTATASC